MSLMSGKSLVAGEGGMLATNSRECWERAVAFGHYERYGDEIQTPSLKPYAGLPLGGLKGRMHQVSAAVGRVQLKYYDERMLEIRRAMNYFWDLLADVPGLRAHRADEGEGSNMAGWYAAHGLYVPEELGGLSVTQFCKAVSAEGAEITPGCNESLPSHPLFQTADVYGDGKPTRVAHAHRDVRELDRDLPVGTALGGRTYSVPWFKHYRPDLIRQYAQAFIKVSENYKALLADDPGNPARLGHWHFIRFAGVK
jgi:dTDP-4-amino-4,6-dideoxygalactose transaminase